MMQAASRLYAGLRGNKLPSLGAWQMYPGGNISRSIARSGFDWVCIDTEHGNIDDAAMHEAVSAVAACGVSPIVRVAGNEGWMFKRALDAGAHAVVVPLLKSAEEARKVVDACKFPPQGSRGFGSPFPMGSLGGVSQLEYLQQANDSLITIVQIETREALEDIENIAQVPGIDVLFVGPFDLGNSIGHPIKDAMAPELKQAVANILAAAHKHGKHAGIYAISAEQAKDFALQGFDMISAANDVAILTSALSDVLKVVRG